MNTHTQTPGLFRSIEHVWIPMPDGVRLAARIWMPVHLPPGGVPAIFEYIPYRKADMVRARDERNHPFLAEHGYVSLRVDMRGSGDSDGVMTDMYAPDELADARHVIDWIVAQEWCNGHVGMFGTSWGGTASLQASIDAPEALKAIIAVCATHDRYEDDIHHKGGCLITDTFEWGATLPSILALPPTPESGDDWYDRWMARLEALHSPVETWVREEARGQYWRHGSIKHCAERIGCPVLSVGGWSDRYSNSVMSLVDACPSKVWGIVGPWGHHYPDHGHPGPAIGFQQVALDWWNHWLRPESRGAETPLWPKLRVWLREFDVPQDALECRNGSWIETDTAKRETQQRHFWLDHGQRLSCQPPDDPGDWPVPKDLSHGLASGDTGYFGRFGGLPLEQSEDDARTLVFETPPLEEDVLLYGSMEAELDIAVKKVRGQICLRLNDVSPDGISARVGFSMLNLALDENLDAPVGRRLDGTRIVRIRLHSAAYRFRVGHRIRLTIGSSYWPIVWTPPRLESLAVKSGRVTLPVLIKEPRDLQEPFPKPVDLPNRKTFEVLEAPRLTRWRENGTEGEIALKWHQPMTSLRYDDTKTTFSYETRADHLIYPDDTNSAQSIFIHHMAVERPDGSASVTSRIQAKCDSDHYFLDGGIKVFWAGEPIFERQWSRSISRRLS